MSRQQLPAQIRALVRPDAYSHPTAPEIRLVQTHVSYVLITGDHVYKVKKPVDFGFVDYSTPAKRKAACEAEVRLNQRGCPEIYLGVVPVTRRNDDAYRIGGEGAVVDYAVHMKRLPEDRMLDEMLARDAVTISMMGALAGRLAHYHAEASAGERITRLGGYRTFSRNWNDNLDRIGAYAGRTLSEGRYDRLRSFAKAYLKAAAPALRAREARGRIRECHGDLRSDAVCFDDSISGGIGFVDCLEFDERLRFSDTGLDVAFLAMDLEFRGRRDLSDVFVGFYTAATGDRELPSLLSGYKSYRAGVRGLVESLTLEAAEVGRNQKAGARRRAKAYFRLAERYARVFASQQAQRPRIVLVMGLSGSGKSVLAGALASRLGAVLLATDVVRREVFGGEPSGRTEGIDAGKYAATQRERIYETMAEQAEAYLRTGRRVVLDGTYIGRGQRQRIEALASDLGAPLMVVECEAPEDVVRQRQQQRQGESWTASEGRWEVYLAQKEAFEPPDEVPARRRVRIDTTLALEAQLEAVTARLPRRR